MDRTYSRVAQPYAGMDDLQAIRSEQRLHRMQRPALLEALLVDEYLARYGRLAIAHDDLLEALLCSLMCKVSSCGQVIGMSTCDIERSLLPEPAALLLLQRSRLGKHRTEYQRASLGIQVQGYRFNVEGQDESPRIRCIGTSCLCHFPQHPSPAPSHLLFLKAEKYLIA